MVLIYDDFDEVYVWVEASDHDVQLSPEFDDKQGAQAWYKRIAEIMS
jgi:hypothetical protein